MAGVRPRHVLCRPSLKGSPTPPNVGVENVPNFFSVHLTGSGGAICQPGARTRCRPDKKNWGVESPEVEDGAARWNDTRKRFRCSCQTIASASAGRLEIIAPSVFMRWLPQQLLQLLLLWSAPPARGGPAEPTTAVLELSASNFTASVTAPGARVLVQFYVPWCGFCKRLAGPYEEAAQRLRKLAQHDPTLVGLMARVNAEAERALASQHGAPPSRQPTLPDWG